MTTSEPFRPDQVRIVPANEADAADLDLVFGSSYPARCRCQRFKVTGWVWRDRTLAERIDMQYEQTRCGEPDAVAACGILRGLDERGVASPASRPRRHVPGTH